MFFVSGFISHFSGFSVILDLIPVVFSVILDFRCYSGVFSVMLDLIPMVFSVILDLSPGFFSNFRSFSGVFHRF